MNIDLENYNRFMEKHVLNPIGIPSYNSLIERSLALKAPESIIKTTENG